MKKHTTLLMCLGLVTQFVGWQATYADTQATESAVYAEADLLYRDTERIRLYAGVRAPRSRSFTMENAQPRHVYFQTQIAFRSSNLLAQQTTGISRVSAPVAPDGDPTLADTLAVLKATRAQLAAVEAALEISGPRPEPRRMRKKDISGAMVRVVETNLLLHELTDYTAEWADIWDRLFQIISYVGGALPAENRYPPLPEHEPGKSIADVAKHMLSIRAAVAPASEAVGVSEVRTKITKPAEGGSSAEGIADLAATFVNDFAEITHRLDAAEVEPPSYQRPARVLASHVYQLASALRQQAETLGEMHKPERR